MSTSMPTLSTPWPPNKHPDSEVLVATTFGNRDRWAACLTAAGIRVRVDPSPTDDLSKVEFAICWNPDPAMLQQCTSLRAIQSMGAGVDSILNIPGIPRHVPLLRVIDPLMAERMSTWVLWGVINAQRRCDVYAAAQRHARWDKSIEDFRNIDNAELRVGVMGMGVMGGAVVDVLVKLGYNVAAWTRRPREQSGVRCFHGDDALLEFAANTDVAICLLPLTQHTHGILNKEFFSAMPRGATLINAARGGHLVEADLLKALDSGHLSSAILDVFSTEPLPEDSPLWAHPSVRVFPHVSSMTNVETAVEQMLSNRECILEGRAPPRELVVDWDAGY